MAGGSKRSRSTSVAVNAGGDAAAPAPKRRKRSRSPPTASHQEEEDEEDDRQPEASTSKSTKPKAARVAPQQQSKQTARTRDNSNSNNNSNGSLTTTGADMGGISTANTNKTGSSSHQSRKTGERAVHRTSGAHGRATLMQDYADLQARHEEQQINYNALREAYQALQELRETGAEVALREVTALNEGRLNAMRKQVANYKKESEELQAQADVLKEEIATLADKQEGGSNANNKDNSPNRRKSNHEGDEGGDDEDDAGEASMENSRDPESSRASSSRKLDGAILNLQTELEESKEKNRLLQEEVDELHEAIDQSRKEKKASSKQWAIEREQLELQLKAKWEKEKRSLLEEREELVTRSAQLEKELAFEVEQSKKLQAVASSHATTSALKIPPLTPSNGAIQSTFEASSSSLSSSPDEVIQLLLDFTGLTLVRRPQEGDKTYNFVMTDYKKRKALNFKLIVDREIGSVHFIPDLLPGRDDEVIESMENAIRGHIKFEYDLIQTFFKRLWRALNGHR